MKTNMPSSIALELVPRTLPGLCEEAQRCRARFPAIDAINIPEIRKMDIKSYPATRALIGEGIRTVPHFRTIDRSAPDLVAMVGTLVQQGLREVLLISGDPPEEEGFLSSGLSPVQAIADIKAKYPLLKVFAGMDAHRTSVKDEMAYCRAKLDAGADGFFTQPFFSVPHLSQWLDLLGGTEVWAGISPVTSESSRKYWETVNQVVFPTGFQVGLQPQAVLGRELLQCAAAAGQKAYLMPITVSAERYLEALLNE